MARLRVAVMAALLLTGACASGQRWVNELPESARNKRDDAWKSLDAEAARPGDPSARAASTSITEAPEAPGEGPRVKLTLSGDGDLFRNTYYDFPRDRGGDRGATVFDAACAPIAQVSREFHDQLCVQGSGRLVSGDTVSFARRDCACAAVCPRTGQKICFERLDPARFPHGRGAANRPIVPLRSVAVDPEVIPLGSALFVPEIVGLPLEGGGVHDGCLLADDKGLKVKGRHIDIFTGDPAMTVRWNQLMPSNRGVHVALGDARCARRASHDVR